MGFHEVVDREVILAVVEPCAAADDLLEFDDRVDRAHQHDVPDVPRVHAGGELLRRREDGRNRLLVVLEVAQVLLAEGPVVRGHALAVVRLLARLHLVDQVAHGQRVVLRGAEDQRLLALVDLLHEQLDPVRFAFLDLDDLVEVRFRVPPAGLDLPLDQLVVGGVDILVERRRDLLDPERRQEAVVDAVLQRIDVDRLAEVGVGVHVLVALGRGGQAELHGGGEVVEDAAPGALVVGPAAMALVDDDEVEEVRRILAEVGAGLAVLRRAAHEGLEDREEQAAVLGHLALLPDVLRRDPHHGILGEGGEGVIRLVGEDVAVGEEEDARAAVRFAAQVPAAVEELPADLEGDEGLARAGGQRQQDAVAAGGDGLQHAVDGDVLVVAALEIPAPVLEGDGGEPVAPGVLLGEGPVPEFVGRRVAGQLAFGPLLHVDAVNALAVGGVGEADGELARVVLGLRHALGQRLIPRLGLDDGQLGVPIDQHVIGAERLAAPPLAFEPAERDRVLPPDPAALDHAPARRREGGVDVLGSGFGFVHGDSPGTPGTPIS